MRKIITKSIAGLVLLGAVALPSIASEHPILSQDHRDCDYFKNRKATAGTYVLTCMKNGTLSKIPESMRRTTLRAVEKYAMGTNYNQNDPKNNSREAKQAYRILKNRAYLKPPSEVLYTYEENRPKQW